MPEPARKGTLLFPCLNNLQHMRGDQQTNKLTSGEAWDVLAATPILLTEDVAVAGL